MTTPLAYSVAIPADPERNVYVRQAYRTKTSFVAVHFNPAGKGEIGFLPAGAILRIIGPSSCLREGFEVMFEEQVYSVFKVDLLAQCSQAQNWQGAALSEPALRQRGMIMAICTCCGTETQLFDTGYPICAACLNTSLAKPPENIDLTKNDAPLRLMHD